VKIIFVDGYNVINSWPNLKKIKNTTFDGARQLLVDVLHNYSVFESCRVFIIFDAYKVSGNIENTEKMSENISIVFTKDGETADGYIEKKVNKLGRKHEVMVVTSDNLEQQTIFQRGAVRMSSLEFYNEVMKTEKIIKKKTGKNYINNKNNLSDNIPESIAKKLEQIRRGR